MRINVLVSLLKALVSSLSLGGAVVDADKSKTAGTALRSKAAWGKLLFQCSQVQIHLSFFLLMICMHVCVSAASTDSMGGAFKMVRVAETQTTEAHHHRSRPLRVVVAAQPYQAKPAKSAVSLLDLLHCALETVVSAPMTPQQVATMAEAFAQ